jgi:hypothetical protein
VNTKAAGVTESNAGALLEQKLLAQSILVVGLARNVVNSIKAEICVLNSALRSFPNLYWLIVESDSDDETAAKLKELKSEIPRFRFLSLGDLQSVMPLRTERLAHCRNKYLEELRDSYQDIDYLIVADLDGTNSLLTEEAVLSCWLKSEWDVCCANQRGPYFDIWALRHTIWSPNDCWSQYNFFVQNHLSAKKAIFAAMYAKMVTIPENSDWIEVESAFGGLAVYRRAVLHDARYIGLTAQREEICEHVTFHNMLRSKGARIFINPRLINCSYTEHSRHLRPQLLYRFRKAFGRKVKHGLSLRIDQLYLAIKLKLGDLTQF